MQRNRVRYALAAAVGAIAIGGFAVANAANDRPSEQETEAATDLPDGSTRTFVAGTAGSVEISRSGDTLTVGQTSPNAGWVVEVEAGAGREVEVQFTSGVERVDFNAELEDGQLRVRVRDDDGVTTSTGPSTSTPGTSTGSAPDGTTPGSTPGSTPITAPDDDFDDDGVDNSGPGSVNSGHEDDGDDNSGPGGGDDDNSGPGSDDDSSDDDNSGNSGPG